MQYARVQRQLMSPMMTPSELLELDCPRWFILKQRLHLSECKHHITALMHATLLQGSTAFNLQFRCSRVSLFQRVTPMTCTYMCGFMYSDMDVDICKDAIALHRTCAQSKLTFLPVTKVTSRTTANR